MKCIRRSIKLLHRGFSCGSAGKESTCDVGDLGSIPGLGRSPGKGKATHSSILACRKESDTAERLSLSVPTCSALPEDENCFPYSNGLELQNYLSSLGFEGQITELMSIP